MPQSSLFYNFDPIYVAALLNVMPLANNYGYKLQRMKLSEIIYHLPQHHHLPLLRPPPPPLLLLLLPLLLLLLLL